MTEQHLSPDAPKIGEAAALFAFMGWLTSRKKVSGPFSRYHEASEAAQLVGTFCESQGWDIENERWHELLRPYPSNEQTIRWLETSSKYMRLKSAAMKIAHQLDGTAYLVGSALFSQVRPRDVDVRIILPNAVFEARYQLTVSDWHWQAATCDWSEKRWRWHEECERYRVMLADACGERTIDLGILPESLWQAVYAAAPHEFWGAWDAPAMSMKAVKKQVKTDPNTLYPDVLY